MVHEIHVSGYIGEMFDLFGDGNYFDLKKLNSELSALKPEVTEINVLINSGGGLVTEGFAIHDKLIDFGKSKGIKVNTIVEGMCGSIATVIAQSNVNGGVRKMFANSEYFIHNPLWIPSAPDAHTAEDLEKLTAELKRNEEKLLNFYLQHTVASSEDLTAKMKAETTLSADEAKALGFIDEVINTNIKAFVKYQIAAAVIDTRKQKNDNKMAQEKVKLTAEAKGIIARLSTLFKAMTGEEIASSTVALEEKLNDGTTIYVDGENVEVGAKVYLDLEMTTAAPDGEHTLESGSVIVVANGEILEVKEAVQANEEVEALKTQIADLQAQLEASKATNETVAKEKETLIANAKKFEAEFNDFKNKIATGGEAFFETVVDKKGEPQPKKDWREIQAEQARKRAEAKK